MLSRGLSAAAAAGAHDPAYRLFAKGRTSRSPVKSRKAENRRAFSATPGLGIVPIGLLSEAGDEDAQGLADFYPRGCWILGVGDEQGRFVQRR
jgi:hypothetical protein